MSSAWSGLARFVLRLALVIICLYLWFASQAFIGSRMPSYVESGEVQQLQMSDGIHNAIKPYTDMIRENKAYSDALLISSSAVIDMLGFFMLFYSLFGSSVRPFIALLGCFFLRQAMQVVCVLPIPEGMIWYDPGVPSVFVTYGVANDMFFSGHTAIAVLGAIELSRYGAAHKKGWLVGIGVLAAVFEISVVLVLRAHYTMDVFTGAVVARYCALWSLYIAPPIDAVINSALGITQEVVEEVTEGVKED